MTLLAIAQRRPRARGVALDKGFEGLCFGAGTLLLVTLGERLPVVPRGIHDPALFVSPSRLQRLCAAEGIDLIVEKIETENQLVDVLDTGFDFGQGYLFGEPRLSRKPE